MGARTYVRTRDASFARPPHVGCWCDGWPVCLFGDEKRFNDHDIDQYVWICMGKLAVAGSGMRASRCLQHYCCSSSLHRSGNEGGAVTRHACMSWASGVPCAHGAVIRERGTVLSDISDPGWISCCSELVRTPPRRARLHSRSCGARDMHRRCLHNERPGRQTLLRAHDGHRTTHHPKKASRCRSLHDCTTIAASIG